MYKSKESKIQKKLETGFMVDGHKFIPACYIKEIVEPDFGCEGRPDFAVINDTVVILSVKEEYTITLEEKLIYKYHLDDKMWVGRMQFESGQMWTAFRDNSPEYVDIPENVRKILLEHLYID